MSPFALPIPGGNDVFVAGVQRRAFCGRAVDGRRFAYHRGHERRLVDVPDLPQVSPTS